MATIRCPTCGKVCKSLGFARHRAKHRDEITMSKAHLALAFEMCYLLKDHAGNVMASGEVSESDKDTYDKCKKFISAYKKALKSN